MSCVDTFIKLIWNDGNVEYEEDYGLDLDAARQDAIFLSKSVTLLMFVLSKLILIITTTKISMLFIVGTKNKEDEKKCKTLKN